MNRATSNNHIDLANIIINQDAMNGIDSKQIVNFRPIWSAPQLAGKEPKIAPIAIIEPTQEPSAGVRTGPGAAVVSFCSLGRTGDVQASTVPTANGPIVALTKKGK